MFEIINLIDTGPLLDFYHSNEVNFVWTDFGHKGRQLGLQYLRDEDPWASAVGSNKGREIEYTNLNPYFKDTVFEEVINMYRLKKVRLMWVNPFACYSMHRDDTARVHIPLITNPQCYFVFQEGKVKYLPAGKVWRVDTTKHHTFINCSDQARLHLVGITE
jgi:hypothetical protein